MGTKAEGLFLLAAVLLAVITVTAIVRHRWQIARSADRAAVATLAAGVRASRKISGKASAYRQRVIEKADASDSQKRPPVE